MSDRVEGRATGDGGRSVLRWGIAGTGAISRSVVADLRMCEGAEIVAVHSRTPENARAFAEEFGIGRASDDYEDLLHSGDIDVVYIATPFALHYDMGRQAVAAGKHVLIEKPMAMNAAEVAELFRMAAERGVFLMEAMWMKFNPAFRALREKVESGVIGEPRSARAGFSIVLPDDGGSRWDLHRSGGSLLDQGIYPVTFAQSLLGLPTAVIASGRVREDGLDLAEHFTLEFSDGRFAQCASGMTEFFDLSASVHGTRGWMTIPTPFWASTDLDVYAGDQAAFLDPPRIGFAREGNGYVPMLRAVHSAVRSGQIVHPLHGVQDTIDVFTTLDEIRAQLSP